MCIWGCRVLTDACRAANSCSRVIWYDAVTSGGLLAWQNKLNELNAEFFAASDAIFINYVWKPGFPADSATAAGPRSQDVFMGIDVFGRNTFGGGGLNCNVAAAAARSEGDTAQHEHEPELCFGQYRQAQAFSMFALSMSRSLCL